MLYTVKRWSEEGKSSASFCREYQSVDWSTHTDTHNGMMRFIVCVLVNHQTSVYVTHIKTSVECDEWEHGSWFVHRTGCSTLNELGPHACERLPASFSDRKQTKRLGFHHVLLCIHWQKHKTGFLSFASTHLLLVDLGRTGVQAMQINNWSLMLPRIASHSFSVRS